MLGVTADTNIYISALEFGGLPRQFLDLARGGLFRLDISEAIKQEILQVLRSKFEYPADALIAVQERLASVTRLVQPAQTIKAITTDPSDNRILECAVAAKSEVIVSGDRHLLLLGSHAGIPVMKVADFLERLKQTRV